jgi:hypothetical protein
MTAPEPPPNPPKLVLCAAFPPELEALRRELAGEPVEFRVLGVGLVDSALGAASAFVAGLPALLVGTVGAYPSSGLAIGALVTAGSLALAADPAELPDMLAGGLTAIPVDGFPVVRVGTTLGVTVDDVLAARLGARHDVEHMEGYAVARAAARIGAPFRAVFAVANGVGAGGRAEWLSNHRRVSDRLARELAPRVRALLATL